MSVLDITLREILGIRRQDVKGVGVEVELESLNSMPPIEYFAETGWSKQSDSSLRGNDSAEYVLTDPRPVSRIPHYLRQLKKVLDTYHTVTTNSVRAGTHIHYDICTHTLKEFYTLLSVWYTVEELLSTKFGEGRKGNHFCLRGIDAEWVVSLVASSASDGAVTKLKSQDIRYCALNLTSLFKYGTIELRALRGTLDEGYVLRWVNILDSIVRNSKLFPDPISVVQNLSEGGEEQFLQQVIGRREAGLFFEEKDASAMLRRGARLAQEIAYARERW